MITLEVEGVSEGKPWSAALEFDYANEESFYCRAPINSDGRRREVPAACGRVRIAYLPPMSGLAPIERRQDEGAIDEISSALSALGMPDPWSPDLKASDEFLDPLFRNFYQRLNLPNLMRKTDYHTLAPYMPAGLFDAEIREKLDAIVAAAGRAKPRGTDT